MVVAAAATAVTVAVEAVEVGIVDGKLRQEAPLGADHGLSANSNNYPLGNRRW